MPEKIAVIGLGYVGWPLATALAKHNEVIGLDSDQARLEYLKKVHQDTPAISLISSYDPDLLSSCTVYVICVPTDIDDNRLPDLSPLISASQAIGPHIDSTKLVIYESTVYPGCIEEKCIPELLSTSPMDSPGDFHYGYSPERINPGDENHSLESVVKIISANTMEALDRMDALYTQVVQADLYRAPSIRIAEAAKVIENTQRDLNIALVNELSLLFKKLNLDTEEVLKAAGTKWNFHPYYPGLVGGHCIGVDPYYLAYKAHEVGFIPRVILAGRERNDGMCAEIFLDLQDQYAGELPAEVLLVGLTFKPNCNDTRRSGMLELANRFNQRGVRVHAIDPHVDVDFHPSYAYMKRLSSLDRADSFPLIIYGVDHDEFQGINWRDYLEDGGFLYDLTMKLPKEQADRRL